MSVTISDLGKKLGTETYQEGTSWAARGGTSTVAAQAAAQFEKQVPKLPAATVPTAVPAATVTPAGYSAPALAPMPTQEIVFEPTEEPTARWKTYALPIGILAAGSALAIVLALLDRKKSVPAVAGLGDVACRTMRKRWIAAERRAHVAMVRKQRKMHQRAEKASEKAFDRANRRGCAWAH